MKTTGLQRVSSVRKHLNKLSEFLSWIGDFKPVEEDYQTPEDKRIANEIEEAENSRKFIPRIDLS